MFHIILSYILRSHTLNIQKDNFIIFALNNHIYFKELEKKKKYFIITQIFTISDVLLFFCREFFFFFRAKEMENKRLFGMFSNMEKLNREIVYRADGQMKTA